MFSRKIIIPVLFVLIALIAFPYYSSSQPRRFQNNPNRAPNQPGPAGRRFIPEARPEGGPIMEGQVTPSRSYGDIPFSSVITLQFALDHYRPLTISIGDVFVRPTYYTGKYVRWNGVIVNDQSPRYMANIPDQSAFYFSVVNPNLKTKKWAKNQNVTVVGKVGSTDNVPTVLGIQKHIPNLEATWVE